MPTRSAELRRNRSVATRFTRAIRAGACAISLIAIGPVDGVAADPSADVRKPPRPERTAAERALAAGRLREVYRGDPAGWPPPQVDPGVEWREIGLLPAVEHPASNPFSPSKVELGRTLFFDARLSVSGKISCASCHEPSLGWADGRPVSQPAAKQPARNTPTVRNAAFQPALFWDGRATSLESQAAEALAEPKEMAATREHVEVLLAASTGYRKLFAAAFPDRPITFEAVVDAIACFERTIVGGRSRFDDFLQGDAAVLSEAEILGLDLFRREARCMNCHHGPVFSDGRFHDLGLSFHGRSNEDLGRFAVTDAVADRGRFRTPTLRDVTQTTPLMHTGIFGLPGVLNMYNAGMVTLKRHPHERHDPLIPVKSPHLRPLGLNRQDLADLAAFLGTLEEPRRPMRPPTLPAIDRGGVTAGEPTNSSR